MSKLSALHIANIKEQIYCLPLGRIQDDKEKVKGKYKKRFLLTEVNIYNRVIRLVYVLNHCQFFLAKQSSIAHWTVTR